MVGKQAISVTLDATNLLWLRARVAAGGLRSVSDLLDRLVSQARKGGSVDPPTSVVGTIDVSSSDPLLLGADAAVRALYESSLDQPLIVREPPQPYRPKPRRGSPRRG